MRQNRELHTRPKVQGLNHDQVEKLFEKDNFKLRPTVSNRVNRLDILAELENGF